MKYIDMHCDTMTVLYRKNGDLLHNDLHVDLEKMEKGECLLQNFAVFTNIARDDSSFTWKVIDFYDQQMELHKDKIRKVMKYEDILENEKNGYRNAMLTLEEGSVVDNDLDQLKAFYDRGVRMITLTWNYPNGIGHPNFTYSKDSKENPLYTFNKKDGLTDFGIEYIRRMEELGIIIDVSHLSDAGFYDVLKYSTKPFVASHSGARSVCGVARNLSDDMIKLLARKGGVTGVNYCSEFIEDHNETYTSIQGMIDHIRHIAKVGGIDCVGLGSDFDGIENQLEIRDASGMQLLYEGLKSYFTEEEIEKIFYKNVLRVYKETLK
ncbi:MAG: dipeptidase [Erysipelotrichaceae bacterium]|nr:dipeptidase [Erysipelotrichaceae bacterium]